jgi:hypothetical protein
VTAVDVRAQASFSSRRALARSAPRSAETGKLRLQSDKGWTVTWVLAVGSYLAVLAVTVLVGTRGRPRRLLGRLPNPGAGDYDPPDAIEKVAIVLYPLLFAALAAVVWTALWFGLYAVD